MGKRVADKDHDVLHPLNIEDLGFVPVEKMSHKEFKKLVIQPLASGGLCKIERVRFVEVANNG